MMKGNDMKDKFIVFTEDEILSEMECGGLKVVKIHATEEDRRQAERGMKEFAKEGETYYIAHVKAVRRTVPKKIVVMEFEDV